MKKLITLILVLTGMVCTAGATNYQVYLIPSSAWNLEDAEEKYSLYMFGHASAAAKFVAFSDSGLGFWTATLEDGYPSIIFIRGDGANDTPLSWENKWNQSEDITFNASTPVYTATSLTGGSDGKSTFSSSALKKLYVKNMDSDANVNFDSWDRGNSYFTWPGQSLTTETIEDITWNVFYWPLSSINGVFTLDDTEESNHCSGGEAFDLSSTKFYYYYPTLHEHVNKDDALAEATTIHFRTNAGDFNPSKFYFWNNDGINSDYCFSNQTVNGYQWKTITTHKPSFNIQFYAGDGGNDDGTKTDNPAVECVSGENAFYVYRLSWCGNSKLDSKYYFISTDDDNGEGNYLAKVEMQNVGNYLYKATIDNVTSTQTHYFDIAPISSLDENHEIASTGWNSIIFSPNWNYDGNKQPYVFSGFTNQQTTTMLGKNDAWNRWKISEPMKYDVYFDFVASTVIVKPFYTTNIGPAGYITYSNGEKCKVSGAEARYVITRDNENGTVHGEEMDANTVWPANEGMILKGKNEDVITISAVASDETASTIGKNYLVGSGNSTADITAETGIYIFAMKSNGLGFYKAEDGTLAAHKAYLDLSRTSFNAREFLGFDFDEGEATGISAAKTEIGQNDQVVYDLQGRKINGQCSKGLYIVNGKKVIIK